MAEACVGGQHRRQRDVQKRREQGDVCRRVESDVCQRIPPCAGSQRRIEHGDLLVAADESALDDVGRRGLRRRSPERPDRAGTPLSSWLPCSSARRGGRSTRKSVLRECAAYSGRPSLVSQSAISCIAAHARLNFGLVDPLGTCPRKSVLVGFAPSDLSGKNRPSPQAGKNLLDMP
jgi:hypothetical protein